MAEFLKYFRRGARSSKVGGDLICPACHTKKKLRYLGSVGRDIDEYVCKNRIVEPCGKSYTCNTSFRYQTTPYDPMGQGMSPSEAKEEAHRGMHRKERARLDKVKRGKKIGKNWMPGIGHLPTSRKKKEPKT